MKDSHMPSLDELIQTAKELGVKMMPCSTTCDVMGIGEGAFFGGVTGPVGAAFFLNEARQSKVTLFI